MTERQAALLEEIRGNWNRYMELKPNIGKAYTNLTEEVYADGAVDGKTKRLAAMTAATVSGCRACILFQSEEAVKLGASKEEILECIGVAISLGGSMAAGEATRLIGFLEEKGVV